MNKKKLHPLNTFSHAPIVHVKSVHDSDLVDDRSPHICVDLEVPLTDGPPVLLRFALTSDEALKLTSLLYDALTSQKARKERLN